MAAFALLTQLAAATIIMPDPAAASVIAGIDAGICHAGSDRTPIHHDDSGHDDSGICPICAAMAMPAPMLLTAPALPAPTLTLIIRPGAVPQARAPPVVRTAAFLARGPPSTVDA